jgi:hypothetical protein
VHRALHLLSLERGSGHDEVKVDAGEHFRILGSALRVDLDHAVGHRRSRFPEDVHDIVSGAAPGADEHGLHRAHAGIAPAAFGRPVHDELVAAFGSTDEAHVVDPLYPGFH